MRLKQILTVVLILLVAIATSSCDRKAEDVTIRTRHYFNTSETVEISTYNGNKLIKSHVMKDDDGNIKVELIFDKPIR